jgi:hypothetical protein
MSFTGGMKPETADSGPAKEVETLDTALTLCTHLLTFPLAQVQVMSFTGGMKPETADSGSAHTHSHTCYLSPMFATQLSTHTYTHTLSLSLTQVKVMSFTGGMKPETADSGSAKEVDTLPRIVLTVHTLTQKHAHTLILSLAQVKVMSFTGGMKPETADSGSAKEVDVEGHDAMTMEEIKAEIEKREEVAKKLYDEAYDLFVVSEGVGERGRQAGGVLGGVGWAQSRGIRLKYPQKGTASKAESAAALLF